MMLRHVEDIDNNRTKVVQARALLDFISVVTKHDNSPHAAYIRGEATKINSCPDEYIAHEYLEKINQPFYFKDFMKDASRHGLQYLNESRISSTWLGIVSSEAAAKLGTITDPVLRGHYMDCITGRSFRETLLVRRKFPCRDIPALNGLQRPASPLLQARRYSTEVFSE